MYKIKTYNQISTRGLDRFSRDNYEVSSESSAPDAYVLRSHKLHGEDIPSCLTAVARAGAGVNNIPISDYTDKGVVVFNTPGANANAVKELVIAAMLLSSRDIIGGMNYAQSLTDMDDPTEMSRQLEKEKKRFAGFELKDRTLGVVGLGAIGSMIANAALAMGMKVVGFDPALSVEAAWRLSSDVVRMDNLHSLLANSDFVTLHVPAIEPTKNMINDAALQSVKQGSILLNFARESIVDTSAVVSALDDGRLSRYVCDFPEPVLLERDDVLATPHLGASTAESEENCAMMAADQIIDFLENGAIRNSVNFPMIELPRTEGYRITIVNDNVSGVLGHLLSVFTDNDINVLDMMNKSRDDIAYNILDVEQQPTQAIIDQLASVEHVVRVRALCSIA